MYLSEFISTVSSTSSNTMDAGNHFIKLAIQKSETCIQLLIMGSIVNFPLWSKNWFTVHTVGYNQPTKKETYTLFVSGRNLFWEISFRGKYLVKQKTIVNGIRFPWSTKNQLIFGGKRFQFF